jgi:phage protein U
VRGVIGILGGVMFESSTGDGPLGVRVRTYENLQRSKGAKYAAHEVHGRKPLLEFTGLDGDTISLSMQLNASLGISPSETISELTAILEGGAAVPLIFGGAPLGLFVLEGISEAWGVVESEGRLVSATVTAQLREYPDG